MRYRSSMKPIKILQWLFRGWLFGLLHWNGLGQCSSAGEPGYLDFDHLPETNFTCHGKVIGGYYADLETQCQMFHVCTIGQLEEPMDIKFLCLNGTVFDQETRVCERVDEVDCSRSEKFYSLNLELYGNTAPPIIEEIDKPNEEDNNSKEHDGSTTHDYVTTPVSTTSTTTKTEVRILSTPGNIVKNYQSSTIPVFTSTSSYHQHKESFKFQPSYNRLKETKPQDVITTHHYPSQNYQYPNVNQQRPSQPLNKQELGQDGLSTLGDYANADPSSQPFSPQQFIYNHNANKKTPALSFQGQFQNGGQNTHVTVTTHTTSVFQQDMSRRPDIPEKIYDTSIRTPDGEEQYEPVKISPYQSFKTGPKRIPLIPSPNTQGHVPTGHSGLSNQNIFSSDLRFRHYPLIPQGFRMTQPTKSPTTTQIQSPAAGQNILISVPSQEAVTVHFNSRPSFHNYGHEPIQTTMVYHSAPFEDEELSVAHHAFQESQRDQGHTELKRSEPRSYEHDANSTRDDDSSQQTIALHNPFIATHPRVIVTATATVSDEKGRKLNYSVGDVVRDNAKLSPTNYDDYKESDVMFDPFFLDVPKLTARVKRAATSLINSKSTMFKWNKNKRKIMKNHVGLRGKYINKLMPTETLTRIRRNLQHDIKELQMISNCTKLQIQPKGVKYQESVNITQTEKMLILPVTTVTSHYPEYSFNQAVLPALEPLEMDELHLIFPPDDWNINDDVILSTKIKTASSNTTKILPKAEHFNQDIPPDYVNDNYEPKTYKVE